jgi:hypothetical protein
MALPSLVQTRAFLDTDDALREREFHEINSSSSGLGLGLMHSMAETKVGKRGVANSTLLLVESRYVTHLLLAMLFTRY